MKTLCLIMKKIKPVFFLIRNWLNFVTDFNGAQKLEVILDFSLIVRHVFAFLIYRTLKEREKKKKNKQD